MEALTDHMVYANSFYFIRHVRLQFVHGKFSAPNLAEKD